MNKEIKPNLCKYGTVFFFLILINFLRETKEASTSIKLGEATIRGEQYKALSFYRL